MIKGSERKGYHCTMPDKIHCRLKRAFRDYEDEEEEAEFKRNEKKRQEERARRAREAYLARSPPRWHEVVMDDGRRRNVYMSSSSKLVKMRKVSNVESPK